MKNSVDVNKKAARTSYVRVKVVGYKKTMKRIRKMNKSTKQLRDTLKEISELRKTSIF